MEADWYEDPLGRFEGRYFDGEHWTDQVSRDGALVIDPDFVVEAADTPVTVEPPDDAPVFDDGQAPAVALLKEPEANRANLLVESPVRTVAVLDEAVLRADAVRKQGRWRWMLAGAVLFLGVIALYLLSSGSDSASDPVASLDEVQEDRVRDLESSGISESAEELSPVDEALRRDAEELEATDPLAAVTSPNGSYAAADSLQVGSLQVVNGVPMLVELATWHEQFAQASGQETVDGSGCWLGQLGGAAVQEVHCGPVGRSGENEYLFNVVPVIFDDISGGQLARPIISDVAFDVVLPNALELIGSEDQPFVFDD